MRIDYTKLDTLLGAVTQTSLAYSGRSADIDRVTVKEVYDGDWYKSVSENAREELPDELSEVDHIEGTKGGDWGYVDIKATSADEETIFARVYMYVDPESVPGEGHYEDGKWVWDDDLASVPVMCAAFTDALKTLAAD